MNTHQPNRRLTLAIAAALLLIASLVLGACAPFAGRSESVSNDGFYGGNSVAYDVAEEQAIFAEAPQAEADFDSAGGVDDKVGNFATGTSSAVAPADRLIIRTGSLSMEVENTIETRADIEALVNEHAQRGAFIVSANESGNTGGGSPYIYMTIRVPSDSFATIMNQLADMAVEVNERWESADDVTEEFVDLESRLEALEAARDRLLEIMQNADTTEDLLRAEQQLTQREAEIEAIQGRMNYLSTSARLSSITVNLTPYIVSQPVDTSWDVLRVIREAFDDLLDNMEDFAEGLIRFLIIGLPALVIWVGIFYLLFRAGRFIWRRLFKPVFAKKDDAEDASDGSESK